MSKQPDNARKARRTQVGRVLKNASDKTIVVAVETKVQHGLYGKTIKKTTTFTAHDEKNETKVGDMVEIMETRPFSKTKRWRLNRLLEKVEKA
jgi:small subunit ribosomal protein S17